MSPDETRERRKRLWVLGALWLSALVLLLVFRGVVIFFAAAALIAYVVAPLVGRIASLRLRGGPVPRWAAILAIYAAFFFVTYVAILTLAPQLYRELARISRETMEQLNALTPERVEQWAIATEERLGSLGLPVELSARSLQESGGLGVSLNIESMLAQAIERLGNLARQNLGDLVSLSQRIVGGVLTGIFMLFFVLMVAAYMSIDSQKIGAYVKSLVPPEYAADVKSLVARIDSSLSGVVRGQVLICLINGVLTFIGLLLLKVKFAVLLATVATAFSLIPIFGSIISSVPIVAIALAQGWQTGFGALAWIVGIHALEAYGLNPKIMGHAARIHPIVVAFSLIAGERTFGLIGAFFAVPVAAIAVACFDYARLKVQPAVEAPKAPAASPSP